MQIDLKAVWGIGRGIFAVWFTAACLFSSFIFMHRVARLSFARSAAAAVMTGLMSWLFVAALPVGFVASLVAESVIFRGGGGVLASVSAIILSALVGAGCGAGVLAAFGQRITRSDLAILFGINLLCVGLAFYQMAAYVAAHPPEA